jgi:Rps23 Pro-64 3,4-dihydroxylase Tpa1-like proline 4-hydroxylase
MTYSWGLRNRALGRFAVVQGLFTHEELTEIVRLGEKQIVQQAMIEDKGNSTFNPHHRSTSVSWIPSLPTENHWLFQKLTDCITEVNERFFNFDLEYIENLQYSVYHIEDFYKEHDDMLDTNPDSRKLSFSLQLTDPKEYDGGELILSIGLNENGERIKAAKEKGAIIFFPSYTIHEVSKVVSGTRKALVGWVNGPRFR